MYNCLSEEKIIQMYKKIDLAELEVGEAIPFGVYTVGKDGYPMKLGETEY